MTEGQNLALHHTAFPLGTWSCGKILVNGFLSPSCRCGWGLAASWASFLSGSLRTQLPWLSLARNHPREQKVKARKRSENVVEHKISKLQTACMPYMKGLLSASPKPTETPIAVSPSYNFKTPKGHLHHQLLKEILLFSLIQNINKSPSCPGWAWCCDPPASASQSAEMIGMHIFQNI